MISAGLFLVQLNLFQLSIVLSASTNLRDVRVRLHANAVRDVKIFDVVGMLELVNDAKCVGKT